MGGDLHAYGVEAWQCQGCRLMEDRYSAETDNLREGKQRPSGIKVRLVPKPRHKGG